MAQIKVFAKITPENKATIVRTYKVQFKQKRDQRSFFKRLLANRLRG